MISRLTSISWLVITVLVCAPASPRAQSIESQEPDRYRLPTKEVQLAAQHRDMVLSAMTVAVIVTARPLMFRESKTSAVVGYRAGRVGPDAAKGEVEQALKEWGAFTVVDDPAQADLVLVVLEETLSPGFGATPDIREPRYRLKDTLGIYRGRNENATEPLWVGIVTEGRLSRALSNSRPSAIGVIDKFRRDVEDARKRIKK